MLKVIFLNLRWHFTYLLKNKTHVTVSLHWYFKAFPLLHILALLPPVLLYLSEFEGIWCLYMTIEMFMFGTPVRIWLDQVNRYKRQSWQKLIILFSFLWKKRKWWIEKETRTLEEAKNILWAQIHITVRSFDSP